MTNRGMEGLQMTGLEEAEEEEEMMVVKGQNSNTRGRWKQDSHWIEEGCLAGLIPAAPVWLQSQQVEMK